MVTAVQVGMHREPVTQQSLVGTRINGTYEVLRELAVGGMSHVYVGRHLVMDREVAIKVLRSDLPPGSDGSARFLQEARATSKLTHPNNITVYDFAQTERGDIFLVMELVGGEPLSALLERRGRLPFKRIARMIVQICGALAEAHEAGIVHRDLKPENIMIEELRHGVRDFMTVLDYGIASLDEPRPRDTKATDEVFTGTPEYTSPEQALGKPVDARSDVYALGVLLYQLVSGDVPFAGDSPLDTLIRQIKVPPPALSPAVLQALPPGLTDLLRDMLAKDPDSRPESCVRVRERLVQVLNSAPRRPTTSLPVVEGMVGAAGDGGADPEPPELEDRESPQEAPAPAVAPARAVRFEDQPPPPVTRRSWVVHPAAAGDEKIKLVPCTFVRSCYRQDEHNLPMGVRWLGPDHVGFVTPPDDPGPEVGRDVGLLVPGSVVGVEVMWVEGRVASRMSSSTGRGHAIIVAVGTQDRPPRWGELAEHWVAASA